MKVGRVVLVGRPNVGKSTLINALVGHKISITSPRPQTTRRIIQGLYWDDQGQIIFLDTPGILAKPRDPISPKVNQLAKQEIARGDLILYLIDHTRPRGLEENRLLGLIRPVKKPKILVYNKIDLPLPDYTADYKFLEDEFDEVVAISALKGTHIKSLLAAIFDHLPEGEPLFDPKFYQSFPAYNLSPEEFVAELIREKALLSLRQEIPYTIGVKTEEIKQTPHLFRIVATIFTTSPRYKPIIIGKKGRKLREIGTQARKELELITGKKVYLQLEVVVNPHWWEEQSLKR